MSTAVLKGVPVHRIVSNEWSNAEWEALLMGLNESHSKSVDEHCDELIGRQLFPVHNAPVRVHFASRPGRINEPQLLVDD